MPDESEVLDSEDFLSDGAVPSSSIVSGPGREEAEGEQSTASDPNEPKLPIGDSPIDDSPGDPPLDSQSGQTSKAGENTDPDMDPCRLAVTDSQIAEFDADVTGLNSDRPAEADEVPLDDSFAEATLRELTVSNPGDQLSLPATTDSSQASPTRKVAFRCVCGTDVLLASDGEGECTSCGRPISLGRINDVHTVSFCGELDTGTTFVVHDTPDRAGESLGHFRLLSKLGYGGMGEVYRALDESLQRFVAVKVIRGHAAGDDKSAKHVTRLLDEAVAQARLNHPNVVTIYYVGRAGEEPFFAMELLPGPTLGHLLQDGPLPYVDVIIYARQVCSALAQAHRLGLVHGDIKPGNLILSDRRTIKLSDFGLAKTEATRSANVVSGTISYLAPELISGANPTQQSDMYSLGVTLFELTFGYRPYEIQGANLKEQVEKQQLAEVGFPAKWPSSVPERFREVILRLLARDPADRYESFEELDQVLRANQAVGVTPASLALRFVALLVDYAALGALLLPLFLLVREIDAGHIAPRYRWLVMLAPLVPLLATFLERHNYRTLGRYLLQLRLVDRHGLPLGRKQRFWRSVIRFSPIWIGCFTLILMALRWENSVALISPVDELLMLVNMLPALGAEKLALHDRLVGSRIVLDTDDNESS